MRNQTKFKAFLLGLTIGYFINLLSFYWLISTLHEYGMIPILISFGIINLMVIYLALYWGIFSFFASLYKNLSTIKKLILLPLLWCVLGFIKGHIVSGFPWLGLEYSQYLNIYFIQISDIVGPYFFSGVIFLIGYLFYFVISTSKKQMRIHLSLILITIFILLYGYGFIRIQTLKPTREIAVGAIQPCLYPEIKDNPRFYNKNFNVYLRQSEEIMMKLPGTKLIVWPETSLRYPLRYDKIKVRKIRNLSKKYNTAFIVGNEDYYKDYTTYNYILKNGAAYIYKDVGPDFYFKRHLVPFGEFIPFRKLLVPFKKYTDILLDFTPGEEYTVFDLDDKFKISVLVCYEIIFPEEVTRYIRNDCNIITNVTNNVWYGYSAGPLQDIAFAVFRAAETKCPVVKSANNGVSLIVNGKGGIQQKLGIDIKGVICDTVEIYNLKTFFSKYPFLFSFLTIFLFIGMNIYVFIKKEKPEKEF